MMVVRSMGNSRPKLSSYGERRLISYWVGARADLSLRWPHMPFLGIGGGVCRNPNFTVTWCTDFRKIVGESDFSEQFGKLINRYKRIGYSLDVVRRTACLVVGPVVVDGCASLFNCTTAVRASDSVAASS